MKRTVVKCISAVALMCTANFALADDSDVEVQFTYDDVKNELVQADELTELLYELGALDPVEEQLALTDELAVTDELMSDESLSALARDGRRGRGDGARRCEPGRCGRDGRGGVDRGRGHRDRDRHRPAPPRRHDPPRHRPAPPRHRPEPPRHRPPRRVAPRPPHRRPPIRPRPPVRRYPHYQYVCYAENARGQRFQATGAFPRRVQQRAMNRCYDWSYRCYELGCY